ncbi:MAG: hypothetical protein Q4C65_06890 [Eubacteriales bacterium]|nr:hypothetical protein [Eubacteriales bacterium]
MRQWTTTSVSEYRADRRTERDILERIRALAQSYVPEWQFDEKNPDIGSVLALLYAEWTKENVERYNALPERYYVELVNMLGISLKPAFPARSVALLQVAANTVAGVALPKGTRLLGIGRQEQNLIFETAHSIYLAEASLNALFMASGKTGRVLPIRGSYPPVAYVSRELTASLPEEMPVEMGTPIEMGVPEESADAMPFSLFDFSGECYGKNALLLYHSHIFDVQENEISLSVQGGKKLLDDLEAGRYRLSCLTEDGWETITRLHRAGEELLSFRKQGKCQKVQEGGQELSLLVLEARTDPEDVVIEGLGFSSEGGPDRAEMVWNGMVELEAERFLPFGESLSLFSELYLGHGEYFSKPGAQVEIRFHLRYEENSVTVTAPREAEDLRVIKRKPRRVFEETPAQVYVQEVSLEYYNGTGWRRLNTEVPVKTLFDSTKERECCIRFCCPADWQDGEAGGYTGRCLRLLLLRADGCYLQPACHHYPVISDLRISYRYEGGYLEPERAVSVCGSRKRQLVLPSGGAERIPVFTRSRYGQTGLYIGLSARPEEGPVSILFELEEENTFSGEGFTVSYSTREGFERLKFSDHTDGLAHTGCLLFLPPSDMAERELEGQRAYWLRLEDVTGRLESGEKGRPLIRGIGINGVEIDNVETLPEEDFYMDEAGPDMRFPIGGGNILSLDVWVNETDQWSENQKRAMLLQEPDRVRAEYDFLGRIERFYVKWEETDSFDLSLPSDRHYLVDRMNNVLCFGDGVHVRIPRMTRDIAFRVTARRCDGAEANLEPGTITDSMGNLMFVERITNPIRAYGGMDMESMDNALHRGSALINSRRRLISTQDYEREALNFSSGIAQARAVAGIRKDGRREDACVSLVLLMKDYREGSHSFRYLQPRLLAHLLDRCELSVNEERLDVTEPLFVDISVDVWVQVPEADDSFETRSWITEILEDYLDPVRNPHWEIGRLPDAQQIRLRLGMEKKRALITRLTVTAAYSDEKGRHETEPETLAGNPFVAVRSGLHRIHVEQK